MALYRVVVKHTTRKGVVCLEKGMSVEIPTNSINNPLYINGGKEVVLAFQRVYGIDLLQFGNFRAFLSAERIR